jgi:tripartite-type tricarboxylate transporter receptor subunit TctC
VDEKVIAMHKSRAQKRISPMLIVACILLLLSGHGQVFAQAYPNKAVRIVAPFPAGGATDINVRRLAERLNKVWGQPVIVDNSAGGAGITAAASVAKSKPDGYTLFFITHPILAINPLLYDKLPYDADKDFSPVVEVTETPSVLLVSPALQVTSVADLISLAKAKPGTLLFGSGGLGTTLHLSGELFKAAAGIDIVHVPYKGGAAALTALMSNEIQMSFDSSSSALRQIQGGRVRGLAVAGANRLLAAPTLPTFIESGLNGVVSSLGNGFVVPTGTPRSVIASINTVVNDVLKNDDYRKLMVDDGVQVVGGSQEQFAQFLANERKKWQVLITKLGIKAQ